MSQHMRVELRCADVEVSTKRQMCILTPTCLSACLSLHRPTFISSSEGPIRATVPLCNAAPPLSSVCLLQRQHGHMLSCNLKFSDLWALIVHLPMGCSCELVFQRPPLLTVLLGAWLPGGVSVLSTRTSSISVMSETWVHITHRPQSECGGLLWEVSSGQGEECETVGGLQRAKVCTMHFAIIKIYKSSNNISKIKNSPVFSRLPPDCTHSFWIWTSNTHTVITCQTALSNKLC